MDETTVGHAGARRDALHAKIKETCELSQRLCMALFFLVSVFFAAAVAGLVRYATAPAGTDVWLGIPSTNQVVGTDMVFTLQNEGGLAASFYGDDASTLRLVYEDGQVLSDEEFTRIVNIVQPNDVRPSGSPSRSRLELLYVAQDGVLPIAEIVSYCLGMPLLLATLWMGARFFRRSALAEGPFRPDRARDIRVAAILLIVYAVVPHLVAYVVAELGPSWLGGHSLVLMETTPLVLGILLFALSWVFKYGSLLQRQDDGLV